MTTVTLLSPGSAQQLLQGHLFFSLPCTYGRGFPRTLGWDEHQYTDAQPEGISPVNLEQGGTDSAFGVNITWSSRPIADV